MRALLLVDLQNDFCKNGALEVPHGDGAVENSNLLIPKFDIVVATQDWHPRGHMSFASNNEGAELFSTVDGQVMWPDHCIQGSKGAELHPYLLTDDICAVVRKGMDPKYDSYSGFFDDDKKSTGLDGLLRDLGADVLHICGLATDVCVKATVLDALELMYEVHLHVDACRGVTMEGHIKAVEEMEENGVTIE